MPLEGHYARQQAPLLGRQRAAVFGVLGALAVCLAVLILAVGDAGSKPGCVDVTIASTTGGAAVHACGERAKQLCSAPGATREIRSACEHAAISKP